MGKWGQLSGVSSGLSHWHHPSQMFHCLSPATPPQGSAVNSGIPLSLPLTVWKDLMMNNKDTRLHIYHFPTGMIGITARDSIWVGSKADGSESCRIRSWTWVMPSDLRAWKVFSADRRTLALRPLSSRAETQMLHCYSGTWIPTRGRHVGNKVGCVKTARTKMFVSLKELGNT